MNIVEHNDNLSTKQASEIERYLLRIIQRYFDNQYIETQNSIEAIIVESLTRMKRDLLYEKSFVFDVNKKAGHLTLNATSLGGEPAFSKNTAFNKDFTPDNQFIADTICEGDDSRLSDKRNPNPHNHNRYDNFIDKNGIPIVDIDGRLLYRIPAGSNLNDLLEQARLTNGESNHAHLNYHSVLKRLRYTGSKTEIDLAKVAVVKASLTGKLDEANGMYNNLPVQVDKALATLKDAEEQAKIYLEYATGLSKTPPAWFDNAIEHVDEVVASIEKYCNDIINSAVTQEDLAYFVENTAKEYIHVYSSNRDVEFDSYSATIKDKTIISESVHSVSLSDASEKILRADAFLKYNIHFDDNTVTTVQTPLPIIQQQPDGTYVHVYCKWDDNTARIICQIRTSLPYEPDDAQKYKDTVIMTNDQLIPVYEVYNFFKNKPARLCIIDSQEKLDFVASLLDPDTIYHINGYGHFSFDMPMPTPDGWYINVNGKEIPMPFENWDTNDPEYSTHQGLRYVYLSSSSMKMISRRTSENVQTKFIYEYVPGRLSDYYDSPTVSYSVYSGKGGD